jgi:ketosteroid isomerase-like protein
MSNADRLMTVLGPVMGPDEIELNEQLIDRMVVAAAPLTSEDTTIQMTAPDQSFQATYQGPDGMRAAWRDWLDVFERLRFRLEGVEQIGDNVVTLARQFGTTRHGGVEIEQPSAAVWKFRDARIVRIEFHLNQDSARESARVPG